MRSLSKSMQGVSTFMTKEERLPLMASFFWWLRVWQHRSAAPAEAHKEVRLIYQLSCERLWGAAGQLTDRNICYLPFTEERQRGKKGTFIQN